MRPRRFSAVAIAALCAAAFTTCKLDTLLQSGNEQAGGTQPPPGPGVPARLSLIIADGDDQSDTIDAFLARPYLVRVRDNAGRPVAGVQLTWTVLEGGGDLFDVEEETDDAGEAMASYRLGDEVGEALVRVRAEGITTSVTFGATVRHGAPDDLSFDQQPGDVAEDVVIRPPVRVSVRDRRGNLAVGYTGGVVVEAAPRGSSLRGTRTRPAVQGVATFDDLSFTRSGTFRLRAEAARADTWSQAFDVDDEHDGILGGSPTP